MKELVIQTHDFEKAKNNLKEFSLMKSDELALKKVEVSGGLFNWFDHKVTGQELNDLIRQIQRYLIRFNDLNAKFIKEFGEVYNALEALDKDYIQAILISVKAAEKASKEAKDAQKDISNTIKVQKQTLGVLTKFKTKLEKYEHLENIDEVWKDTQRFSEELKSIYKQIDNIIQITQDQSNSIINLNQFKKELSKFEHLTDIDLLWDEAQNFKSNINSVNEQLKNSMKMVDSQGQSINDLIRYKKELDRLKHLYEIDEVWENTQIISENIESIYNQIEDINNQLKVQGQDIEVLIQFKEVIDRYKYLNEIDNLWEDVQKSKSENKSIKVKVEFLEKQLFETEQQLNEDKINYDGQINKLLKKIKIAYILSGSSIGITILLFVLNLVGIL